MNSGEKKNFSISINEDQIANLSSSELESLLRSGILQGDEAETVKQIMVDKEKARRKIIVKEIHPAAIISPSPGSKKPRYRTYIKVRDPKTGKEKRKEIARTHEDDLYEWLYLYYKKGFEPKVCTHVLITLESLFGEWIEYKKIHTTAENNIERVIRTWKQYYVGADIIKTDITAIRPIDIDMWIHRVIKDNQMDKQKYLNFSLIIRQMLKYARMKERIRMTRMGREFEEEKRAAEARGEARGEAKGEANGVAKCVRALMKSMKISAKAAMDMLSVPDGMRSSVSMLL